MLRRRLITIPGYVIVATLWLASTPLWLPLAALIDLLRRRQGIALRSAGIFTVYLSCEIIGLAASAGLWARKSLFGFEAESWADVHFRLEAWWGATLFRAVTALFGLRIEVESDADLERGPYLLLLRHTSTVDTLLASALVSRNFGLRLRYVLKDELLWDPCLDIVGNRLPNAFVDRFSDDSRLEIRRVQELARNLGPKDGVLIYPEGTRYSEAKRRRLEERFRENGDTAMLEYARSLARVLPPRPGGTLGLIEAAPEADIVICAHTGLEGAASLARIWSGELLHQVIRIQFRRIPRDAIPDERDARVAWIQEEWKRVGAWVEKQRLRELPPDGLEAKAGPWK